MNKSLLPVVTALLVVVCLIQTYRVMQLQALVEEAMISVEMLEVCTEQVEAGHRDNEISDADLAPRLLKDQEEITRYVEDFPVDDYTVYSVDLGTMAVQFYLDQSADVIKNVLKEGKVWESYIIDKIVRYARRGSTVLDIGAHIGSHSLFMSAMVGGNGRVYGFEPQKKLYREYVHNMRLNGVDNVIPLRYAAGDTNAVIEMNPATTGNEGGTSVGEGGDQAELRTVDSFNFKNVSLIKIDVEYLEDAVLEGARETILREKPVLLVEIQGGYNPETAPPEIMQKKAATVKKIESMGYKVVRFHPYDYLAIPH